MNNLLPLKKYMAFDSEIGASEGAVLVFAEGEEEAKKIVCDNSDISEFFSSYSEVSLRLLEDEYFDEYKEHDKPHALTPPTCKECLTWGISELDENGLCEDCRECEHEESETEDCPFCIGTGEGGASGFSCGHCGGSGVGTKVVCLECGEVLK